MRKTLFIAVLAICLLFAFSSVAMAKYAGYGYNIDGDNHVGYLSWAGAVKAVPAQAGSSPHGGYTANTVKCAVCHSAHRAATDQTTAGVGADWKLTPGGNSCIACHTASGSNPSAKLVEWPSSYALGGPHNGFNCMLQCHAGVHGAVASEYGTAAKFLLNPSIRTTQYGSYAPPTAGLGLDDGLAKAIAAGNLGGTVSAATLQTWPTTPAQQAGARAMVTGYLCSQGGCHTASQFAVNATGYAEERTLPGLPMFLDGPYDQMFTGHKTSFNTMHCSTSGCHQVAGDTSDSTCAACHDFKGVVTGTSAWPHANRNINVYEWVRSEAGTLTAETTLVARNNLWMYTGDVTYRDENGVPTSTPMWDGKSGAGITHGAAVEGFAPNRINTRKILNGNAAYSGVNGVGIRDGVCLKCHGFIYWPVHGEGSFGNPASPSFDRNFANY